VQYAALEDEYNAEPGAANRLEKGNRIFWVQAAGLEKAVKVNYMSFPQVDTLNEALRSLIPEYAFTGRGGPADNLPPADRFVADRATRRFHHPECELAQDIKSADRELFKDWEDALNFKYDPCPVCKPMDGD